MRLGEILKHAGIIDDFQLNSALSYQRHWGGRFGESLIKLGYISEQKLQDFLARQFELPRVELFGRKIPDDVLQYIPASKAREFHVVPVERQEMSGTIHLVVAMTDPTNLIAIDSLQFMTGCRIKPALASAESITHALNINYANIDDEQEELDLKLEDITAPAAEPEPEPAPEPAPAPAPPPPPAPVVDCVSPMVHKRLEERYENLIRILLDKEILTPKDLDELM
jgi:type IV pilus assembly protein PilB